MGTYSQPLVTVYIPTYNRVELLKRAVQSVQQQTYQNLEIIIVDDCSTDGTHDYLKTLSTEDSRVRCFLKEKNSGACVSRNIAIENASGEFITGLDDDDYFLENRIQDFLNNIHLLHKYLFLCTTNIVETKDKIIKSNFDRIKPICISSRDLLSINYIGNQIFIKTEILKEIKFNPSIPIWQDFYTWYNLLINNSAKKAYVMHIYNYVMDVSHPHERISNKKIDKIYEAYEIFCEDFNLGFFQKKVLKVHMMNYSLNEKSKLSLLFSLFSSFNFYNVLYVSSRFFRVSK